MTKKHSTKKALIASALSLLICVSMLVGTTFAWFTDSVTSSGNKIVSGSLNIDLSVMDKNGDYQSVKNNSDAIFDYTLWEPGYTEWKNIKVSTTGNLALKYAMNIVLNGERSILADVIDVYYAASEIAKPTTRSFDGLGLTYLGTISEVLDGATGALITDTLNPAEGDTEDCATIVLKMQESAGNNYQGKTIGEFDIKLFATQYTYEEDSFDANYDDAAWVVANADATAGTASELSEALKNGGLIALTSDIEGDVTLDDIAENTIVNFAGNTINGTVTVAEGQSVTLNGVGGVNATGSDPAIALDKNTNVTLAGGTYTSEDEAINIKNRTEAPMTLTIEEGTVITAPTIVWLDSSSNNAGANIVINGGEFNSTYEKSDARPIKVHGGNVTINGGTFTIDNPTGTNCYFVDISSAYNTTTDGTNNKYIMGNVEINGGTFKSNVPYTRAVFASISRGHTLGTVVINDGYFEFTADNSYLIDVPSNVVVNDCTYIGVKSANVFNISSTNPTDQTIVVNGGNYTVRTLPAGCFNYTYANRVILKGGTINSDKKLTDSLADGYKVVDNGNGTYSIVAE